MKLLQFIALLALVATSSGDSGGWFSKLPFGYGEKSEAKSADLVQKDEEAQASSSVSAEAGPTAGALSSPSASSSSASSSGSNDMLKSDALDYNEGNLGFSLDGNPANNNNNDNDDDDGGRVRYEIPSETPPIDLNPPMAGAGGSSAVPTIHTLDQQQHHHQSAGGGHHYNPYDREPQQSPFVDRTASHPTVSHTMDPRFSHPRQCQEGQYLCRKASPQQEHIRCIPNAWKCNGVRDCEENDDEANCMIEMHRPAQNECNARTQYTCYGSGVNGLPAFCIDSHKLCDGVYDCTHGDDESKDRCEQYAQTRQQQQQQQSTSDVSSSSSSSAHSQSVDMGNSGTGSGQSQDSATITGQQQQPPQQQYPTRMQNAPTHNPDDPYYQQQQHHQQQHASAPPSCSGKNEEYVKRLEWIDRCFRSCLRGGR